MDPLPRGHWWHYGIITSHFSEEEAGTQRRAGTASCHPAEVAKRVLRRPQVCGRRGRCKGQSPAEALTRAWAAQEGRKAPGARSPRWTGLRKSGDRGQGARQGPEQWSQRLDCGKELQGQPERQGSWELRGGCASPRFRGTPACPGTAPMSLRMGVSCSHGHSNSREQRGQAPRRTWRWRSRGWSAMRAQSLTQLTRSPSSPGRKPLGTSTWHCDSRLSHMGGRQWGCGAFRWLPRPHHAPQDPAAAPGQH